MPPKEDKKKTKKIDKTAPIDVDGAISEMGSMDINHEVTQEEQKKAARPEYWSDTSDDESYGKIEITQRRHFKVYGGHQNDRFYTPPAGNRDGNEQGDHVVNLNLLRYFIASLERENIKTLPTKFYEVTSVIFPEMKEEIRQISENLKKEIEESRNFRKETTSQMGDPKKREDDTEENHKIKSLKEKLIGKDKYEIHRVIEAAASDFIERLDANNSFSSKRRSSGEFHKKLVRTPEEGTTLDRLIGLDEFLGTEGEIDADFINFSNGRTGNHRGSDLVPFVNFGKRYRGTETPGSRTELAKSLNDLRSNEDHTVMLKHIALLASRLLDYERTKLSDRYATREDIKEDHKIWPNISEGSLMRFDDEKVLYEATGRVFTIIFSVFKNINSKLTHDEKEYVYNEFLTRVVEDKGWKVEKKQQNEAGAEETLVDTHYVMDSNNQKQRITPDILRDGVAKFAKIDFGKKGDQNRVAIIKMRDPNDPNPAERPQEVLYCDDRAVVAATTSGKKSTSSKEAAKSDFKADDSYDPIDAMTSSAATPILSGNKSKTIGSLFRTQSLPTKLEFDPATEKKPKKVTKKSAEATDSSENLLGTPSPSASGAKVKTLKQKVNSGASIGDS